MCRDLVHRLKAIFRRKSVEHELDSELRVHIEFQVEKHIQAGLSPEDAARRVRSEFGGLDQVKEEYRDTLGISLLETVVQDIRYALRMMRRNLGFTLVTVLSLTLAIGANTSIFSFVNALMLRDLRVKSANELVELGRSVEGTLGNFSYPIYGRIRDENSVFSGVLAMSKVTVEAAIDNAQRQPIGRFVSANFFEVLGISPTTGQILFSADDRSNAAEGLALTVISYGLWQREFSGDPSIVGKTLKIDTVPFTIVAVLPRSFEGLIVGGADDFYIPMASEPLLRRESWLNKRDSNWLAIVGRLEPGTPIEAAKANLDLIFEHFLENFASTIADVDRQRRIRAQRLTIESAQAGLSDPRREFSRPVLVLMGAVSLVLLIACANVASLLLTRGMVRRREISLRLAIGASRGRLIRQLLTESAALGLIGGVLGLLLATWGTRFIAALIADGNPAVSFEIAPDGRALVFTGVVSLGSALLAGIAPALRAARTSVAPGMRDDVRTLNSSRTSTLWTRVLISGQVALSLLLLIGASLLVFSLRNLHEFDAGFDRDHVLLIGLSPGRAGYSGARRLEYYRQVLERARNAPGVQAAGLSLVTPISGILFDQSFGVEGQSPESGAVVYANDVSDGYFAAMGTPLLQGRDFTPQDGPDAIPVAVINEALSRRYFKGENPIGRRVRLGRQDVLEIVGVVANAKYGSLREESHPTVYAHPLQTKRDTGGLTLSVRTSADPLTLAPAIRRDVKAVAETVPITPGSKLSTWDSS